MPTVELFRRRLLVALAASIGLLLIARCVWADPFTFLQPGFSQELYGVAPRLLGDVAFAPDADVWAPNCIGSATRFDQQATTVIHSTTVHPEAAGSPFPTSDECGVANHPNGFLYANSSDGVVKLDPQTAEVVGGPFGFAGSQTGIATDPVTGSLVYVRSDGGIEFVDSNFTSSGLFSGATFDLQIEGLTFDPTGTFLFATSQGSLRAPSGSLFVINRDGGTVQEVRLELLPAGVALHAAPDAFVVLSNRNGSMTRLDFPGNDYTQPPAQSVFASGGFAGNLMQVGADGALYVTQEGTRFDDGTVTEDTSIVRISGGFQPPPGVGPPPTLQFDPPTPPDGTTFNVTAGQPLSFTVKASQPGGVTVALSANGIPPGAAQSPPLPAFGNPVSSDFSWTPGLSDVGSYPITYRATDEDSGRFVETSLTIVVQLPPMPQFVAPTPANGTIFNVTAGKTLTFTVKATENSGVTLTASALPSGATQSPPLPTSGNPVASTFSWTPGSSDVGSRDITYRATDDSGNFVETSVTVVVSAPPAPQFVSPTPEEGHIFTVRAGQRVTFTVEATQDSTLPLTLDVDGLPTGATQSPSLPANGNPATSTFSWRPGAGDVGSHTLHYRVVDLLDQVARRSITILVQRSPVLSVRLSLFNSASKLVAQVLLKRRADGSFVGSFPNLKPGLYRAFANGYASSDGTGPIIATAAGTATVLRHRTVTLHLNWS